MTGASFDLAVDMEVPEGADREYLFAGLENLIRRRGFEALVCAPIVLPTPEFFPEAVTRTPAGARTLLRRLMRYAGLDSYQAELYVFERQPGMVGSLDLALPIDRPDHAGAAAWYAGCEDNRAFFGVNRAELRDPLALVGTLAHEVAHLYRDHHALVVTSRDTEELLTDLTTVYLGFGALLLESSYTFRTGGYSAEGHALAYESNSRGYLTLGSLALLLGAQLAVRGLDRREVRRITSCLSANQADLLRRVHTELAQQVPALRESLAIPGPDQWPAPADPSTLSAALDAQDDAQHIHQGTETGVEAEEVDETAGQDTPATVAEPRPGRPSPLPAVVFGAVGFACGAYFHDVMQWLLACLGLALGGAMALRARPLQCSNCRAPLNTDIDWCAGCDAHIDWERAPASR